MTPCVQILLIQTLQCLEMALYTLTANQEACHEEAVILRTQEFALHSQFNVIFSRPLLRYQFFKKKVFRYCSSLRVFFNSATVSLSIIR